MDRATRHHLTTLATRLEEELRVTESMIGAVPAICSPATATQHIVRYGDEAHKLRQQLDAVRETLNG